MRTSAICERDVVRQEVEQLISWERNALTMHPACTLTAFCRVYATRVIADDARKMDAWWLYLRLLTFPFSSPILVLWRLATIPTFPSYYVVVSFLLFDITVSCEPTNVTASTLSCV